MRPARFTASAAGLALLAACAGPAVAPSALTPTQRAVLQHGEWQVVAIDGRAPAAAITLRLAADGRLAGHAGCNGFTGSYTIEGDRFQPVAVASTTAGSLAVGPLASTRKACAPAVMADEQRFLGLLERANGIAMGSVTGAADTLQLLTPPAHRIEARRR
ncbi:MAG: META domain-containing protein [Pseudomonadota bacterium]